MATDNQSNQQLNGNPHSTAKEQTEFARGKNSFCVVLPMFNEQANAQRCIATIFEHLKNQKTPFGIIAVNDGSRDSTKKLLQNLLGVIPNFMMENHELNQGYGAANLTGARRAFDEGFEYILFMDGDLTQRASYIDDFIAEMEKGIDYIKATRYSKGGGVEGVPFKRRLVSYIGNKAAKACLRLPLNDYTNGFRAMKSKFVPQLKCTERGFAYLIEEVSQMKDLAQSFSEVPYTLTVRTEPDSVSKFNYSLKTYLNYLKHLVKK